jgi:hypothetical protein
MRFERRFMFEQLIEPAIQSVFVDLQLIQLQQIGERRAPVPVLRNVQLAGGFAQSCRDQHRGDLLPADLLLARCQHLAAKLLEPHPAPQSQRQIHITELPRALNAHALQTYRHGPLIRAVVEQRRLFRRADQASRQRACLQAPFGIEFTELRDGLLNHAPTHAHTLHQSPIAMRLAVFLARRVPQIHAAYQNRSDEKSQRPRSALHALFGLKSHASR